MRILLDTHVFLWWLNDDARLSAVAREMIVSAADVFVSSATIWEASIKVALGKLEVDVDRLVAEIQLGGFRELPITARHAAMVKNLPPVHRDPFDRILVAQALAEPLRLVTGDTILKGYPALVDLI